MAFASPLKDIEDKYFECSYCLENFKEPKLLPCVHRFCRNCLKTVIGKLVDNFNCPLCNYLCDIPADGVDGFRTDFHMKSLLQYIQLQQSAKTEEIKKCAGCSNEAKISSHCFKCKGFLCEQCHQIHMTLPMMREHKTSVLSLRDIRDHKLTLERLSSFHTENPRCHVHVEKLAEVCCGTCSNLPVCVVCGHHGKHKGHELHDVTILAQQERERIKNSLFTIEKYSANVQQLPAKVEEAKRKLNENIRDRKDKLRSQYTKETEKIRRQLQEINDRLEMNKAEIDFLEKQELVDLEREREKEIEAAVKKVNDKYDKLIDEKKTKNQNLRDDQDSLYGEKRAKMNRKLAFIDGEFKDLHNSIDMQGDQNLEEIRIISKDADNRKIRFDNFKSSVSSILASKNDWTLAQCLPEISTASDSLTKCVRREYPELQSSTQITVSDLPPFTADAVSITEEAESVINIDEIKDFKGHAIYNMTTTDNGSIIITGDVDDKNTHITVINRQGKVMCQYKRMNVAPVSRTNRQYHYRSCSDHSIFKVASTCSDSEVGIYNIQNKTYIKRDMGDVTSSLVTSVLTCVAVDRNNKHIYVGSHSRDVFILDDELNYCHTLHLPEMMECSSDIAIHDGELIVCDYPKKRACIATTDGPEAKLVCDLSKPVHGGICDWSPFSVCIDSFGFIYILWHTNNSVQGRRLLTQHSQDGCKLLITKPVDDNAYGITTVIVENTQKLLLGASDKMYTYGLVMD